MIGSDSTRRLPTLAEIRAELSRRQSQLEQAALDQGLDAVRARCQGPGSLARFIKEAWHILEPKTQLKWNWHLDAICAHLEAITFGTFLKMGLRNRLLINVPPGSMKSLIVSVFWQAWEWGPCGMSHIRILTTAYSDIPVNRDNYKFQVLVTSEWFQRHWPLGLPRLANGTIRNKPAMGERLSAPLGSVTGVRGDRFVFDDPHSTTEAESDVQRANVITQFREGIQNRMNDPVESAIVVIMQRLHANDVSGVILRELHGWIHLCLPMEFEPDRKCVTPIFEDPRTQEGELLDYARYTDESWGLLKSDITNYAFVGQYQQRPTSREGSMFMRAWFADKRVRVIPFGSKGVRHWDLAATADKKAANPAAVSSAGARTAGVKMFRTPDGRFIVADSKLLREEGAVVKTTIKAVAQSEKGIEISLPQDPGQAGKVQKDDFARFLAGFRVHIEPETGEKAARAQPFADQCELGNVYLLDASGPDEPEPAWITPYIDELCDFPTGRFKDQVDASSGAFGRLVKGKGGMVGMPVVVTAARGAPDAHPENMAPRG